MNTSNPYEELARRLDALPNGFPAAKDGAHLRILEYLFAPEEASLAASLSDGYESVGPIAARNGIDPAACRGRLKDMARRGLILAGKTAGGMGYRVMPFVVGIYEMQGDRMDAKLARLFENYFRTSFRQALSIQPPFQRVLPVRESLQSDLSIAPFETAAGIVDRSAAWAVTPCICRKQKALIGEACRHPVDVCMILADTAGVFHGRTGVRELNREEAHRVLRECAEAGLVHSVSNTRDGNWYICNCCTCSCGILRAWRRAGWRRWSLIRVSFPASTRRFVTGAAFARRPVRSPRSRWKAPPG